MAKVVSKKFTGNRKKEDIMKQAKALGFTVDTAEYDEGSDCVWLRRMYPRGFEMPVQVRYNVTNGSFTANTPFSNVVSERSSEMDGIDWYDELLLLFYIPDIKKGDTVTVNAQGIRVTGTVHSADNYGDTGWYIELTGADVPGGYSYWKQRDDGGFITGWVPASEGGKA